MKDTQIDNPDLVIEKLKIWIHGRQFPEATDSWDSNWLDVTAKYESGVSSVTTSGCILSLREIKMFLEDCEKALQGLVESIELPTMEPNISLELKLNKLGHIKGVLKITSDHMSEWHEYSFEIDQSYLPNIISQCKKILTEYPIKDGQSEK